MKEHFKVCQERSLSEKGPVAISTMTGWNRLEIHVESQLLPCNLDSQSALIMSCFPESSQSSACGDEQTRYCQTWELRPSKGLGVSGPIFQVVSFARFGSKVWSCTHAPSWAMTSAIGGSHVRQRPCQAELANAMIARSECLRRKSYTIKKKCFSLNFTYVVAFCRLNRRFGPTFSVRNSHFSGGRIFKMHSESAEGLKLRVRNFRWCKPDLTTNGRSLWEGSTCTGVGGENFRWLHRPWHSCFGTLTVCLLDLQLVAQASKNGKSHDYDQQLHVWDKVSYPSPKSRSQNAKDRVTVGDARNCPHTGMHESPNLNGQKHP